jgi:hypothetical protein
MSAIENAADNTDRVQRIRMLLGSLDTLTIRIKRQSKDGQAHHVLRPEARDELLLLLAELDEMFEREAAYKRDERELSKLVASMKANTRDASAPNLAREYEQRERDALEGTRPVHRDPVVELTAFFAGAFVRSDDPPPDWISVDGRPWLATNDDAPTSRAISAAVEVAGRVFGQRAARPLNSPRTSTQLSKLHDNHERNHGYILNGERVKQTLWTPERWALFDVKLSTER